MLTNLIFIANLVSAKINLPLISTKVINSVTGEENIFYYANISIGDQTQNIQAVVETASAWIVVNDFYEIPSETCTNNKKNITVLGNPLTGELCFNTFYLEDKQISDQAFILINSTKEALNFGILGLGFSKLSDNYLNVIENLGLQSQINDKYFSIHLRQNDSFLTIGGYSDNYSEDESSLIKVMDFEGHWLTSVNSFGFNFQNTFTRTLGYFDLNANKIMAPQNEFQFLIENFEELGCENVNFDYICSCIYGNYSNFPNFTIDIDENSFEITPVNYLVHVDEKNCKIMIGLNDQNVWKLGRPFFLEYYVMFDSENFNIKAIKILLIDGGTGFNTIYIVGIVVLCIIILIPLCFYIMLSKIRGVARMPDSYSKLD